MDVLNRKKMINGKDSEAHWNDSFHSWNVGWRKLVVQWGLVTIVVWSSKVSSDKVNLFLEKRVITQLSATAEQTVIMPNPELFL